jgi:uncharacterized membrane protein YgcG
VSNIYQLVSQFIRRIPSTSILPRLILLMKIEDSLSVVLSGHRLTRGSRSYIYFRFLASISLRFATLRIRRGDFRHSRENVDPDPRTSLIAIPRSARDTDLKSDSNSQGVTDGGKGDGAGGASGGGGKNEGWSAPRLIVHSWGIYSVSP